LSFKVGSAQRAKKRAREQGYETVAQSASYLRVLSDSKGIVSKLKSKGKGQGKKSEKKAPAFLCDNLVIICTLNLARELTYVKLIAD
jgi:hypothetical protein